jgi:colicin import membrane protein
MTLQNAVEEMDIDSWAALTRRVAADVVAAAGRLGQEPPKELAALAELSEYELIARRKRGQNLINRPSETAQPGVVQANEPRHAGGAQTEPKPKGRPLVADSVPATELLTIPIAPIDVRPATRRIENALTALHQLDYVLEVGTAEEVKSQIPPDIEMVRGLVSMLQREATSLPAELDAIPGRFTSQSLRQAAADYVNAATTTYSALMRRIETAAGRLRSREQNPDAEIVELVTTMLKEVGSPRDTSRP